MFNLDTINTRLNRVNTYFGELAPILSGGVTTKAPNEIDTPDANSGLEEARFSSHLLTYGTDEKIDQAQRDAIISLYITKLKGLEQKALEYKGSPEKLNKFFTWSLDYETVQHAPIWVRQADRLARDALLPQFSAKLSANAKSEITKIYELYKSVQQGIEVRREKHVQWEQGFDRLFPKAKFEELRQKIAPWGADDINKHVAKYLLESHKGETETEVQARIEALRQYVTVLEQNHTDPEAIELMKWLKKDYESFPKHYVGKLPQEMHAIIEEGIQVFAKK